MVAEHIHEIADEMEENLLVHNLMPKPFSKEKKVKLILKLEEIEEKHYRQLTLSDVDWLYDQI